MISPLFCSSPCLGVGMFTAICRRGILSMSEHDRFHRHALRKLVHVMEFSSHEVR